METAKETRPNAFATEQDVLSSEFERNLVPASTGKRFANMILDIIGFYILFFMLSIVFFASNPDAAQEYAENADSGSSPFTVYLIAYLILISYYTLLETVLKGKSFGKLITGTRAVNESDGSRISFSTALLRSLCRIVPFEAFSALGGHPWHDKWTNTLVIDEKQSTL